MKLISKRAGNQRKKCEKGCPLVSPFSNKQITSYTPQWQEDHPCIICAYDRGFKAGFKIGEEKIKSKIEELLHKLETENNKHKIKVAQQA